MNTTIHTLQLANTENGAVTTIDAVLPYDTEMGEWETAVTVGEQISESDATYIEDDETTFVVIAQNADGEVDTGIVNCLGAKPRGIRLVQPMKHADIIDNELLIRVKQPNTIPHNSLPENLQELNNKNVQ